MRRFFRELRSDPLNVLLIGVVQLLIWSDRILQEVKRAWWMITGVKYHRMVDPKFKCVYYVRR